MSDLIDREKAIDFLGEEPEVWYGEPEEYAAREQKWNRRAGEQE